MIRAVDSGVVFVEHGREARHDTVCVQRAAAGKICTVARSRGVDKQVIGSILVCHRTTGLVPVRK